jgi:carboxymethylenebutenolidase
MAVSAEWIEYGKVPSVGYLCYPSRAKLPLPAILVVQEAWGIDSHIEDVTRRFAAAGYAAFAPDLYSVSGERPAVLTRERIAELLSFLDAVPPTAFMDPRVRDEALKKLPENERTRIDETRTAILGDVGKPGLIPREAHLPRLLSAVQFLRQECAVTRGQKVASVGFCMGGGLSALLACHDPELAAAVVFYGAAPPEDLIANIRCPVLGLYGAADQRINAGIPAFEEAMQRHRRRFDKRIYDGAGHSFFNDTRPSYDVHAARDAFLRTLEVFRSTLV